METMLGGSNDGTLKPGAPMVKGSNDSAEESESVMNLDSSELKSEPDADADELGSGKPRLPLWPFAVGVRDAEEPESDEAEGGCGIANDIAREAGCAPVDEQRAGLFRLYTQPGRSEKSKRSWREGAWDPRSRRWGLGERVSPMDPPYARL